MSAHTLVVGIGQPLRGDDAIGLEVARALRGYDPVGVTVCEASGDASALLGHFSSAPRVVVIDAARGVAPGEVRRIDATREEIPHASATSSHALGLADAIEMARALGRMPAELVVFGVGGARFRLGDALSAAAREAVPNVVRRILQEVSECTSSR